jgi:ABC-2 type transport system ATP-binding protein
VTAILQLTALHKSYGSELALDGLTLEVRPGEIHAIVGLNGAGKTTLMRACVGMLRPDAGTVRVFGSSPDAAGSETWARVGQMIETPLAYRELTARQNLVAAARLHGLAPDAAREAASVWLDRLALTHWAERRSGALSLGNRQRLGLACALAHGPGLVILDEPTIALDPNGVVLVRDALVESAAAGAGVLVSSHHLDEVGRIAHRISVIHAGRVVGTLEPGGVDLEHRFFEMVHAYDAERAATASRTEAA